MNTTLSHATSTRVRSFVWQHILLLLSLYLMTLGVVLCIKSVLGSSVISSIPFVLSLAGAEGLVPALTVGAYTIAMNFALVLCQILVLRRRFEYVQLFQLVVGFIFGWMIDLNAAILAPLECTTLPLQIAVQLAGCTIMGIAIAFEVRCGSVTMPGEGISIAVSQVTKRPFAKVKICIDSLLVAIAVAASFAFFGRWLGSVIGVGTIFAMVYVGIVVKFTARHIGWFDRVLHYVPGFRRYIFGLARFIRK